MREGTFCWWSLISFPNFSCSLRETGVTDKGQAVLAEALGRKRLSSLKYVWLLISI